MDFRVISIGTMDAHPIWGERAAVRTPHATTTLIRAGKANILVDPSLPEPALAARLSERSGLQPQDITHVFLTCFRPDLRRGIGAFENAAWLISEPEREGVGVPLVAGLQRAAAEGEHELKARLELDIAILHRCEPAPDRLAREVALFPLPGVTPGLSGLLLESRRFTVLVTGDAIATGEHLEQPQIVRWAADVARAKESFAEAVEIADLIVPGRDNLLVNPTKRPF